MKHRRGIDLVGENGGIGNTLGGGSRRSTPEQAYRVEVWTAEPGSGGILVETISRSTDFAVSCAALKAAVRARPGKVLVHMNARYHMSCERAPDPPLPELQRPRQLMAGPRHSDRIMPTV